VVKVNYDSDKKQKQPLDQAETEAYNGRTRY
jgi:hypothetical protein